MSADLRCPCGGQLVAQGPQLSRCNSCGRPANVPPRSLHSFWAAPLLIGGATLLLVTGLGFGLVRLLPPRPPRPSAPSPEAAVVTKPPALQATPAPVITPPAPEAGIKPDEGQVPQRPALAPTTVDVPGKPLPPARPPATVARPKPAGDLQAGDRFFQEVGVSRLSSYASLAGNFAQNTRYVLLSSIEVVQKKADGALVVKQKVEGVRLGNAGGALQAELNALLQKTKGATFTYELDARRQVVNFAGEREAIKVFTGPNPLGGQTFLLWSFLDADGWKELAQLSFFRPPGPAKQGQTWSLPMTHSWGPLGSWSGRALYAHLAKKDTLDHYQYALNLAYRPPRGAGGALPVQIGKADFRIQTAAGTIAYDARKGRVAGFEERFHVRGVVGVSALGVNTAITMDEAQVFQVRILDGNPWKE